MCGGCSIAAWSLNAGATGFKWGLRTHRDPEVAQLVSGSALVVAVVLVQAQAPVTKATRRDVLGSSRRLRFLGRRRSCGRTGDAFSYEEQSQYRIQLVKSSEEVLLSCVCAVYARW